jgi:hypothetical protein
MKTFNFTILLLLLINGISKAQFLQDVQGRPIFESKHVDVVGTPFLNENWVSGTIVLQNGLIYKDILLKYSEYDDELFFKNLKDNSMMSFVQPVKSFELLGKKYENGLPAIDNFTQQSFYELITDGKVKLLFKTYKTILESKPYNSATTEKKFQDYKAYYILRDDKINRFKPSKKDVLETFKDKNLEIDAFIKREKVDFKNNADLDKVFKYYNAL